VNFKNLPGFHLPACCKTWCTAPEITGIQGNDEGYLKSTVNAFERNKEKELQQKVLF